jgi:hypothetical protein
MPLLNWEALAVTFKAMEVELLCSYTSLEEAGLKNTH